MSGAETKPIPQGRFGSDLIGTLKTVNVADWGIRGILISEAGEEFIYNIEYVKTPKNQIPILSKGDKVILTRIWISVYKGKITKWNGKEQAKLCKNAVVQVLEKAEPTENTQHTERVPTSVTTSSKAIISNVQSFENLQKKIEETQEKLTNLHKIASLKESVAIDPKDFLRVTAECSLHFHRMLCAILLILEREE